MNSTSPVSSPRIAWRLLCSLCLASSVATASTLFQFGPSATYTERQEAFLDQNGRKLTWGDKRVFSESVPLTPPNLSPAVYGGFELNKFSEGTVFTDYEGTPTTGVNHKTFAGRTLDSIGVEVGFTGSAQPQDVSFSAAFLVLGRLTGPVGEVGEIAISTRLNYRMIGEVPGSLRVVVRAGGRFYVSDDEIRLRATSDRTINVPAVALRTGTWRHYEPHETVAYDADAKPGKPAGDIDFAGVLVTRVVNEVGITYADFSTMEIAELLVESARR